MTDSVVKRLLRILETTSSAHKVHVSMNESLRTDQAHVAIVSGAQRCELWIDSATGTERNPMSNEAIQLKFMQNTEPIIGRERASRASEMVWSLEMHDLGELVASCE